MAIRLRSCGLATWRGLSRYIHHEVFLPSLALSITHLTILSFSGQMVTYLFSVGFSSASIGLMRTTSVVLEMSATWVAPWAMNKVGPLRAGLWSISEQIFLLVGAVIAFWVVKSPSMSALSLVVGVVLSRAGLWGFDLSVQVLVQEVCFYGILSNSLGFVLTSTGRRSRSERNFLIHRSVIPEFLRTLGVCVYNCLLSPRPISIPGHNEYHRCHFRGCNLCWIFKRSQRSSDASINLHRRETSKTFQTATTCNQYPNARPIGNGKS